MGDYAGIDSGLECLFPLRPAALAGSKGRREGGTPKGLSRWQVTFRLDSNEKSVPRGAVIRLRSPLVRWKRAGCESWFTVSDSAVPSLYIVQFSEYDARNPALVRAERIHPAVIGWVLLRIRR